MAIQYWAARKQKKKQRLLTFRGGYHGDTMGAMSVCDPVTGMHGLFAQTLCTQVFCERPALRFEESWRSQAIDDFATQLRMHHRDIAAVIVEPIVQGAGGMWFYHAQYLREIRQLCDDFDVLLIFDEIATGFGRSGELFAQAHAGITPDIMSLGKALTGGTMTLAATLASDKVARTISEGQPGVFMHGPTFMANPLACAAANASIELLFENDWSVQVTRIERQLRDGLEPLRGHGNVTDVRVLGAIGVVETKQPANMERIPQAFIERGVWVRPFGKLVYVMPPYVISETELATVIAAIGEVVGDPRLFL